MTEPKYDPRLLDHRSTLAPLSKVLAPPYDLLSNRPRLEYLRLSVNLGIDDSPRTAARLAEVDAEKQRRRTFAVAGSCGD